MQLGDAFLMSSLFHEVEEALAHLGLGELTGDQWDVVVGGLGLGYTAAAALSHLEVASLLVVDALQPVIDWHQQGLVPLGATLVEDARCRLIHGDFFAAAQGSEGFDPQQPGRRFHAVLLDIDHSPRELLHPANAAFYEKAGLLALAQHLHPGGVFALWSDDPPDDAFLEVLAGSFRHGAGAHRQFSESAAREEFGKHGLRRDQGEQLTASPERGTPFPRSGESPTVV